MATSKFYIGLFIQLILGLSPLFGVNTEYLILTSEAFEESAISFSQLHSELVDEDHQLITKIIYTESFTSGQITSAEIRSFILEQIDDSHELKYLLLIGDETIIPPIYYDGQSENPSDDFYSSQDELSGIPQLSTGRIPVNNPSVALAISEKISNYILNPVFGSWRSKIALLADDQHKNGAYESNELHHTENSNTLYNYIQDQLIPIPYYGILYDVENGSEGLLHPVLNANILDMINSGVSLINYIGHGSRTTLADEKIIDMDRDLNQICPQSSPCASGKLPIWLVGTCSFGQYDGNESMSEALLRHEAGAIALITTTRSIGANTNFTFVEKLFEQVSNFVEDDSNFMRIGDLVRMAKNDNGSEYLFHLFGDPALPLPFPKKSNSIVDEAQLDTPFTVLEENNITLNGNSQSSIILSTSPQPQEFIFGEDTLHISMPGDVIYQGDFTSNEICFRIPRDVNVCDTCTVSLSLFSQDSDNGSIQIINEIPIIDAEINLSDFDGPLLTLTYDGNELSNGMWITSGATFTISIEDPLGLNLMDEYEHNMRYWFNNDFKSYSIDSQLFEYKGTCQNGFATFSIPTSIPNGKNKIYIEAWDSANNRTEISFDITIFENTDFQIYNVYNFPNPFKDKTHFTYWLSGEESAQVIIKIYAQNGRLIQVLNHNAILGFNSIYWDGKDSGNNKIPNGPYLYHFEASSKNNKFEQIYKLAKIK